LIGSEVDEGRAGLRLAAAVLLVVRSAPMREFHKIWIDQCEAARDIRERFGLQKALGYLIGKNFINFLRAAEDHPEFAREIPAFAVEILDIFDRAEIRAHLDTVRRVGPLGHAATDEEYEVLLEAGAVDESPVRWAQEILLIEHAKELLLG
jgi:hypothetical protein